MLKKKTTPNKNVKELSILRMANELLISHLGQMQTRVYDLERTVINQAVEINDNKMTIKNLQDEVSL